MYFEDGWINEGDAFNIGRATQWTFADDLAVKPKVGSEKLVWQFRSLDKWRVQLFAKVTPAVLLTGNLRTLHSRLTLYAPGAIGVHEDFKSVASL